MPSFSSIFRPRIMLRFRQNVTSVPLQHLASLPAHSTPAPRSISSTNHPIPSHSRGTGPAFKPSHLCQRTRQYRLAAIRSPTKSVGFVHRIFQGQEHRANPPHRDSPETHGWTNTPQPSAPISQFPGRGDYRNTSHFVEGSDVIEIGQSGRRTAAPPHC